MEHPLYYFIFEKIFLTFFFVRILKTVSNRKKLFTLLGSTQKVAVVMHI